MKNVFALCGVLSVAVMVFGEENSNVEPFRLGVGGFMGIDRIGASARTWINEKYGFELQGFRNWEATLEGAEAQFKYKWNTPSKITPYILAGGGFQLRDQLNAITPEYNVAMGTFTAGAGVEKMWEHEHKHGFSAEMAYVGGSTEYKTTTGTETVEADPFSFRLMYHLYIFPTSKSDRDKDGVYDKLDRCPKVAEDKDGFEDTDGCPELDNDQDGIADDQDKCPTKAEDKDGFEDNDGCPELDNDNDGVEDSKDKCPNEAEDKDGFEDKDGCPELDNDKDGIEDSKDKCPTVAENFNKFEDTDGCLDTLPVVKAVANIPTKQIAFEVGSAKLKPVSLPILNQLADTLKAWPEVQMEIQGHTDNTGDAAKNTQLSKDRATSVRTYLESRGVAANRLRSEGYGSDKPAQTNDTPEGREANRRVEIVPVQ